MNRRWSVGAAVLVVAAMSMPCLGQYQKNYQTNQGQVLDKSPMVGSGGFNGGGGQGQVGAYGNMARDAALYVNGQTTGLSAFQGSVPYTPSDQFQIGLPSSSLSNFTRASVGLSDVTMGNTLGAAPYFDRSKTILSSSAIQGGYASPGTNVPLVPTVDASVRATLTSQAYVDALKDYKEVLSSPAGRAISAQIQELPTALYVRATLDVQTDNWTMAPQQYVRVLEGAVPGRGMLLDLLNERDRSDLGQQLYEFFQARKQSALGVTPSLGNPLRTEPNYALYQYDPNDWKVKASVLGGPTEANALAAPPRENVDIFMDILERMRQRREGAGIGAGMAAPGLLGRPQGTKPPEPRAVEIVGNNQIVIHSLAGRGRDLANRNMTEAEQRLKAGKFYEASDAYEMAASLNLRNPLPHVGRALALLGAGEPASAAAEIRAALDVFPPLMEARMDLGGMMNLAVLRSRLAELDARLKQSEPEADSLLPFLACYLHYQVDDTDQAKTYANQIRSGDSKNKMVKAFAEFVLTGHRPRSQAQTQPASAPATAPAKAGEITPPAP